jgi:hypothetical protein
MRESKRFLGLELAGAKNEKSSLSTLEYYPKEQKIFLLDIYDKITWKDHECTGDQAVLNLIEEVRSESTILGVSSAMELPPCIQCTRKVCPLPSKCSVPAVKWMRSFSNSLTRSNKARKQSIKEFTPYTQRPVELWIKHHVLKALPAEYVDNSGFEVDEALGGNRAPLTARMNFLKRHLHKIEIVEVLPKLSVVILASQMGLGKKVVSNYRRIETGIHARIEILETLAKEHGIFIYDRDMRKLSHSLAAFHSFISAYTALLADLHQCAKAPPHFPVESGWVQHPAYD